MSGGTRRLRLWLWLRELQRAERPRRTSTTRKGSGQVVMGPQQPRPQVQAQIPAPPPPPRPKARPDGGVVDRPTLAVIGEAGREAVVPLAPPRPKARPVTGPTRGPIGPSGQAKAETHKVTFQLVADQAEDAVRTLTDVVDEPCTDPHAYMRYLTNAELADHTRALLAEHSRRSARRPWAAP